MTPFDGRGQDEGPGDGPSRPGGNRRAQNPGGVIVVASEIAKKGEFQTKEIVLRSGFYGHSTEREERWTLVGRTIHELPTDQFRTNDHFVRLEPYLVTTDEDVWIAVKRHERARLAPDEAGYPRFDEQLEIYRLTEILPQYAKPVLLREED